ncbi:hypothetical protein SELMODRAFT_414527 [Selaginella moellendorffii]|uniref:Uncharacterized protein n=1 Tax=Selaginella moellendorffii TaxID=88036 RepID=D8RT19_SELML|nr:hypothetical protein SELMODRAFT_414527 [Selaginella moellendorffii]
MRLFFARQVDVPPLMNACEPCSIPTIWITCPQICSARDDQHHEEKKDMRSYWIFREFGQAICMDALEAGLKQAVAAYSRGQPGRFVVATNVPWGVYDACDSSWRLEYRRGEVLAYGDPSIVHSTVSSALERSIIFCIIQIPGIGLASLTKVITGTGASRLRTITGNKEPDACFFSGSSLAQPARAVLEVAYKNEPLEVLREVLDLWVESGCLVAIGVKIARPGDEFTFVARESGKDAMEIQFGPEFCNEQNRERFVVKFPVSSFTAHVKGDYYVEFDLFWLQQYIFRMIEHERQASEQIEQERGALELESRNLSAVNLCEP